MYIGIIGRKNEDKITFNQEIINVIYKYNCVPIGIIVNFNNDPNKEFNKIKNLLDMCNGFILQGGSDYYDIDILITKYLYDKNIPTLGICLGMQTMGYFFNGNLGRLANNNHDSKNKYMHSVILDETSKLYKILNKKNLDVNSRHKDYLIKTDLKVVGISNDNIIEAIEDKNKRFFIGVQWHPETMIEYDKIMKRLFEYFINTCSKGEKNDSKKIT